MNKRYYSLIGVGLFVLAVAVADAAVPLKVNHQGLVADGGALFNGSAEFRFAFVDPDTGENRWTNDGTSVPGPGTPTNAVTLQVSNGIYSVTLGDTAITNMTAIASTVFDDDNIVLRIWFDNTTSGGVQQLSPDHELTSSPYAFKVHDGMTLSGFQSVTGDKTFTGAISFDSITQLLTGSQVGDIFVHGASGVERVAPGPTGYILTSQGPGVTPTWIDPGTLSSTANVATGSYQGNDTTFRVISVPFTPDAVAIISSTNYSYWIIPPLNHYQSGGLQEQWDANGQVVTNGFTVGGPSAGNHTTANHGQRSYVWIAWKNSN